MGNLRSLRYQTFCVFLFLVLVVTQVSGYLYKVGDLHAWGMPTSANPHVYTNWPKKHNFKIGDSLLFLYPPSQDSVIQVTEQAFNTCNLKDPILYLDDGNSLFNLTSPGKFYFTSGTTGHCEKSQKLEINVLSGDGSAFPPSLGPSALSETAPSYPTVFGSIPSTSFSLQLRSVSASVAFAIGLAIFALIGSSI